MNPGDEVYLHLSDEFKETLRRFSIWPPNKELLDAINAHVESTGEEYVKCTIVDMWAERDVDVSCATFDITEDDPLHVYVSDLVSETPSSV